MICKACKKGTLKKFCHWYKCDKCGKAHYYTINKEVEPLNPKIMDTIKTDIATPFGRAYADRVSK